MFDLQSSVDRAVARFLQPARELQLEYSPLPSQKSFHDLNCYAKGFSGPVGSGKSKALAAEAIYQAYRNPGEYGILGAPVYRQLRTVTKVALISLLAESGIPFRERKSEDTITLTQPRSTILLKSLDEPQNLRGPNAAWCGVDELSYASKEAWDILLQRVRVGKRPARFAVWTPRGFDWVYRNFKSPEALPGFEMVLATPRENAANLSEGYYESLESSYDERFFKQEVLGEYLSMGAGTVYYAFDRNVHVDSNVVYNPFRPLLLTCDFNLDPMSWLICQLADDPSTWLSTTRPGPRLHVLDEIYLRDCRTNRACEEFWSRAEKLTKMRPVEVMAYGDASGNARQTTGSSNWNMIQSWANNHGGDIRLNADLPDANPSVEERTNAVNSMLRNAQGNVRVAIHPRCRMLIRDLEEVRWSDKVPGEIDKRQKELTHISDAAGYLISRKFGRQPKGHNIVDTSKALPGMPYA